MPKPRQIIWTMLEMQVRGPLARGYRMRLRGLWSKNLAPEWSLSDRSSRCDEAAESKELGVSSKQAMTFGVCIMRNPGWR
jgi:hypothetical protein